MQRKTLDEIYIILTPQAREAIGNSTVDEFIASQRWWTNKEIAAELSGKTCLICLDQGWSCELHEDTPWSGIVGDDFGCVPDCIGPGVVCRRYGDETHES